MIRHKINSLRMFDQNPGEFGSGDKISLEETARFSLEHWPQDFLELMKLAVGYAQSEYDFKHFNVKGSPGVTATMYLLFKTEEDLNAYLIVK